MVIMQLASFGIRLLVFAPVAPAILKGEADGCICINSESVESPVCFFFFQTDLVSTVGESAALGASGVIMWGGTKDYNNKVTTALSSSITGCTGLLSVKQGSSSLLTLEQDSHAIINIHTFTKSICENHLIAFHTFLPK